MKCTPLLLILAGLLLSSCDNQNKKVDSASRKIEILFLGHDSKHHPSYDYMPILASAFAKDGINLTYTDKTSDLNESNLDKYDGLIIYANHEYIAPGQEAALLNYVKEGHGFIPIHCASYCFHNSDEYVALVGAQFLKHKTDSFRADIIAPAHPALADVKEFETWDETYVHHRVADDLTILMERDEGDHKEPWTWVKEYGEGRVFYTAYGHDEKTWTNPGFQQLIKQGILWAIAPEVKEKWEAFISEIPRLQYNERDSIPNYERRDPKPQYQEPLTPEESKKLIQVPKGFELSLFASEPDIINPIAMEWDESGRLWVIETVDYPNTVRNEDGVGDDRIKICEDTDGDGKADKFTVFVDNLNIPTSMVFANGGVIVSQAPHFLFLKDTDGDDKADVRETLITGWGTFDTHAGPSNLKYGIDNKIWGVLGYSGFEGMIGNEPFKFRQGVFRFSPDVSSFEYLTRTSNNTWGLGFTEGNEAFASTANNTHSVYLGIPNKYFKGVEGIRPQSSEKIDGHYAMHPITDKVRQVDVWGGFTAASGHNFYTARAYPDEYWNKVAFVCEPTGHLVHIAKLENSGAGFKEMDGWNLFAGADEWVAPVEAKVGPDGQVWVADWYNFIVQHNPTPRPDRGGYQAENGDGNAYVNPLRDKRHGRIWRVVYKGSEREVPITSLSKDDPEGLIAALQSDNMFWRMTAQRLLVERADHDILPELYQLVKSNKPDEIGQNPAGMHALWIIHSLGVLDGKNQEAYNIVVKAMDHNSSAVRKAAIEVLPASLWSKESMIASGVLEDEDHQVRLSAILKLAEMPSSINTGKMLYNMITTEDYGKDPWLSRAIYTTAVKNSNGFIDRYLEDHPGFKISTDSTFIQSMVSDQDKFMLAYYQEPSVESSTLAEERSDAKKINISVIKNEMKYDIKSFTVTAGETVEITFSNPDFMQHNLLIIEPGTLETVGMAADELARSPQGADKNYVPGIPQVLFNTPLVDPNNTVTLTFTAPDKPGEYPFVCTFPGHWRIMNGTMKVVGPETASL